MQIGLDPAVASARMNQYEKGVHSPNLSTVTEIDSVLGVPTAYFFCERDDEAQVLKLLYTLSDDKRKDAITA